MKIIVNGEPHDSTAGSLDLVLTELGYENTLIATAVNGDFVPAGDRPERSLNEGDRLEVLSPTQGG